MKCSHCHSNMYFNAKTMHFECTSCFCDEPLDEPFELEFCKILNTWGIEDIRLI